MIRVLVADDQGMIRRGLSGLLETAGGIEVVGEAEDGDRAVELTRSLVPDLVLMDLRMPGRDGVEAISLIRADPALTGVRILVLTTFENDDSVIRALQAGADGFLGKAAGPEELLDAVRAVAAGETFLSPAATATVVGHLNRQGGDVLMPVAESNHLISTLTERELEILAFVATGATNDEIADKLEISSLTVRTHVNRIMKKFEVSHRAKLVAVAFQAGIQGRS